MTQAITICAPNWKIQESYGRIANELRDAFTRRGIHVNTLGDFAPEDKFEVALGGIFLAYPTNFGAFGLLPNLGSRICVTMFESDTLPEGWVESLNKCRAVIVPSRWCAETFKLNGVTAPIEVVPLGVSDVYTYQPRALSVPDDYVHNFVAIGFLNARKGFSELCAAFYAAFQDDPHYKLTFKNRKDDLALLTAFKAENMTLIRSDFSDAEMNEFYGKFDYMVFPSHGEGFGLPPREFAATGGIAIATNYAGLADDIEDWGVPIPVFELEEGWTGTAVHAGVGQWAKIDPEVLAETLRHAVSSRHDLISIAEPTAQKVRELYNWDTFAAKVLSVWEGVHGND